jgi:WD40 repeat protein
LDSIPHAVAWSANGSAIIVACKDGRARSIDPDTMEVTATLPGIDGIAYSLAIAPDGSIAIGGQNGQIKSLKLPAPR